MKPKNVKSDTRELEMIARFDDKIFTAKPGDDCLPEREYWLVLLFIGNVYIAKIEKNLCAVVGEHELIMESGESITNHKIIHEKADRIRGHANPVSDTVLAEATESHLSI